MVEKNNSRGILFMSLGFLSFSLCDTTAKLLTESFNPLQVAWMRMSGLFIGVIFLLILRGPGLLKTLRPKFQILRGALAAGSATLFIIALNYVPLADAIAVSFIAPFIVTVLGALVLKEPVGIRRWAAVTAGFIGMLIVIRPGLNVFHPAMLLVVFAASCFAVRQLVSRWLSGVDPVVTTVAYTAITAFSIITVVQPFVWETPGTVKTYFLIFLMASTAAVGEVLIVQALDIAQSVVLAPLHYTLILWGTLFGFVVFRDLPDMWTLVGCIVIIISGLYTTYREFQIKRSKASSAD